MEGCMRTLEAVKQSVGLWLHVVYMSMPTVALAVHGSQRPKVQRDLFLMKRIRAGSYGMSMAARSRASPLPSEHMDPLPKPHDPH
ncbi:unnamed protein product [Gadus morhua 'NCC']